MPIRMQVIERANHWMERTARSLEDVEILQQRHTVTVHVKQAAPDTAPSWLARPEPCFGEMKRDGISSSRHRNGVGEMAIALWRVHLPQGDAALPP